jgi:hypothetical protein
VRLALATVPLIVLVIVELAGGDIRNGWSTIAVLSGAYLVLAVVSLWRTKSRRVPKTRNLRGDVGLSEQDARADS